MTIANADAMNGTPKEPIQIKLELVGRTTWPRDGPLKIYIPTRAEISEAGTSARDIAGDIANRAIEYAWQHRPEEVVFVDGAGKAIELNYSGKSAERTARVALANQIAGNIRRTARSDGITDSDRPIAAFIKQYGRIALDTAGHFVEGAVPTGVASAAVAVHGYGASQEQMGTAMTWGALIGGLGDAANYLLKVHSARKVAGTLDGDREKYQLRSHLKVVGERLEKCLETLGKSGGMPYM